MSYFLLDIDIVLLNILNPVTSFLFRYSNSSIIKEHKLIDIYFLYYTIKNLKQHYNRSLAIFVFSEKILINIKIESFMQ